MTKRILVPSGIGDFSWTWSKLVTTQDKYIVEYIGGQPDRMQAYMKLLPVDRIASYVSNGNYFTKWAGKQLMHVSRNLRMSPQLPVPHRYCELGEGLVFLESNTYLEAGNRLEGWFAQEIPGTDFHYKMNGALDKAKRGNYFIVNFSSYGTKKAWGYYEVPIAADIVEYLSKSTGWMPVFIGGTYDDFTSDVYLEMTKRHDGAVNLVGKTPNLTEVVVMLQQARFYFGACSGLMCLSNVLYTPVATYYPPFQTPPGRYLAGMWHDPEIPYLSLFWEGKDKDIMALETFIKSL